MQAAPVQSSRVQDKHGERFLPNCFQKVMMHARTSFSKVSTRLAFPKSRFQKRRPEAQNFGGLCALLNGRSLCSTETHMIVYFYWIMHRS